MLKTTRRIAAAAAVTAMLSAGALAERGRDGHLDILYWQAAYSDTLSHTSSLI